MSKKAIKHRTPGGPAKSPPQREINRGGTRLGAGRPPEARAKVRSYSKEAAARIVEHGPITGNWSPDLMPELPDDSTPLDVLIEAMRTAYRLGGPLAAAPFAEKAAPYLHGKISSVELRFNKGAGEGDTGTRLLVEFVDSDTAHDDLGKVAS